ncbi:DUF350 domain-containing protein [Ferrimonas aestuarii]|uniref:DUF350 domain-containing protein n=1 Tax=Ferrimonas aestuarii TaxID=2569539 RepID=A0A4U1BT12_9GAMM|nr:DUF350 domain-containing protein [Ferrimonas aestuarii]TKB56757.1 DUF350 domain-containing protein [Ferrimonas aestuarii]
MTLTQWWQTDGILLLLQIGISLLLFPLLRFSQGWWDGVSSHEELAERDNLAFGISTAAAFIAMAIMLSGVLNNPMPIGYLDMSLTLVAFGVLGILLMRLSSFCIDRFALPRIDKRELILKGNVAMASLDATALISAALVIRSLFDFVGVRPSIAAIISALLIYFTSLLLLTLISLLLQYRHNRRHFGPFQQAIQQDHRSVAIAHCGPLLACAMVLASATLQLDLGSQRPLQDLWHWLMVSGVSLSILLLWRRLLTTWVMMKINPGKEIALQDNGGIAALASAQWLAVAWLLNVILSSL